jgi:hypothetical protein
MNKRNRLLAVAGAHYLLGTGAVIEDTLQQIDVTITIVDSQDPESLLEFTAPHPPTNQGHAHGRSAET